MIIAIDVGKIGAIAVSETDSFAHMRVFKMFTNRTDLLEFFMERKDADVWIEQQQIRHSDIKTGAVFRVVDGLIRNYHDILFCCEALGIKHQTIPAKEWQKKYELPKNYSKKKSALGHIAKRKYPGLKPTLQTADAILILEHVLVQKSYE